MYNALYNNLSSFTCARCGFKPIYNDVDKIRLFTFFRGRFSSKVAENHFLLFYGIWGSKDLNFLVTFNDVLLIYLPISLEHPSELCWAWRESLTSVSRYMLQAAEAPENIYEYICSIFYMLHLSNSANIYLAAFDYGNYICPIYGFDIPVTCDIFASFLECLHVAHLASFFLHYWKGLYLCSLFEQRGCIDFS